MCCVVFSVRPHSPSFRPSRKQQSGGSTPTNSALPPLQSSLKSTGGVRSSMSAGDPFGCVRPLFTEPSLVSPRLWVQCKPKTHQEQRASIVEWTSLSHRSHLKHEVATKYGILHSMPYFRRESTVLCVSPRSLFSSLRAVFTVSFSCTTSFTSRSLNERIGVRSVLFLYRSRDSLTIHQRPVSIKQH